MGLETAGGDDARGLDDRPGDEKAVLPMRARRRDLDVTVRAELVEVEELGVERPGQRRDALLLEDLRRRLRPAPVADGQALGSLFADRAEDGFQRVDVGRTGRFIGRVEVRLDEDVPALERIDLQKLEALLDAVGPGIGPDQNDARFRRGDGREPARGPGRERCDAGDTCARDEEFPPRHPAALLHGRPPSLKLASVDGLNLPHPHFSAQRVRPCLRISGSPGRLINYGS